MDLHINTLMALAKIFIYAMLEPGVNRPFVTNDLIVTIFVSVNYYNTM